MKEKNYLKTMILRISQEQKEKLKNKSKEKNMNKSQYIRYLIDNN